MKLKISILIATGILLCVAIASCGKESQKNSVPQASNPKTPATNSSRQRFNQIILPPNEIPAAETVNMLRKDADLGSPKASCRLAVELETCRRSAVYKEFLERVNGQDGHSTEITDSLSLDPIQSARRQLARLEKHCESVSELDYSNAFRYQKNAAMRSPELMRWLVASPALNRSEFLSSLEEWSEYKALAEDYIQESIRDADSDSYFTVLFAYQPKSEISRVIPLSIDDDGMFVALVELGIRNRVRLPSKILEASNNLKARPSVFASAQEKSRLLDIYGWDRKEINAPFTKSFNELPGKSLCVQM